MPASQSTFLVDIKTTITCSLNPELENDTSALYESLSARAFTIVCNILTNDVTDVFVASMDDVTSQFVGFRCFNDTLAIMLQVQLESTEMNPDMVEIAIQNTLTANMADGSLDDPLYIAASISVDPNGVTANDTAQGTDLECSDGCYTDIPSLECVRCAKGTYGTVSVPELCFPCPRGVTTAGQGAFGAEEDLCLIGNPDDYIPI